jgi:uncharacterized protein (DUF1778 family)
MKTGFLDELTLAIIQKTYVTEKNRTETCLVRVLNVHLIYYRLIIMATKEIKQSKARFDTRLSKEQKVFFERAARVGGYRSLTDFVVLTVQEKAKEIISEKEQIIASERDSEIFFDAITNSPKANKNLINATNDYKALLAE